MDVLHGERSEIVLLEEIEDRGPEELKDKADVIEVFEALRQVNTFAEGKTGGSILFPLALI